MATKLVNRDIPIKCIRVSKFHWEREHTADDIQKTADSLAEDGQLHQITVRPVGKGGHSYELISGKKRLMALKLNKVETARCAVANYDDERARIISIRENLLVSPLTKQQREAAVKELHSILKAQNERVEERERAREDELKKAEERRGNRKAGKEKEGNKSPPAREKSRGRPKGKRSPAAKATQQVAEITGMSEEQVRLMVKRGEDLVPTAIAALEEKKISIDQANQLAAMSVEEQDEQLPLMMRETKKATRERLATTRVSTTKGDTAAAARMLSQIFGAAAELNDQINEALTFMDSKELEYPELLKLNRGPARACSSALDEILRFLEAD